MNPALYNKSSKYKSLICKIVNLNILQSFLKPITIHNNIIWTNSNPSYLPKSQPLKSLFDNNNSKRKRLNISKKINLKRKKRKNWQKRESWSWINFMLERKKLKHKTMVKWKYLWQMIKSNLHWKNFTNQTKYKANLTKTGTLFIISSKVFTFYHKN